LCALFLEVFVLMTVTKTARAAQDTGRPGNRGGLKPYTLDAVTESEPAERWPGRDAAALRPRSEVATADDTHHHPTRPTATVAGKKQEGEGW
jgi:hypothetical protein